MGIDGNSRDLFSRIVFGAQFSLVIGISTITFAILIGGILGSLAGFLGGWSDMLIMRILDVLLAFPSLLLAIAIVTVLGPGMINALLAIAIVSIPVYSRVMRAGVLSVKELDFVYASRALGASTLRILFTRVLPNALTPLIVQGTLGIATAILFGGGLELSGSGRRIPDPRMGPDAGRGAQQHLQCAAPGLLPRPGDHADSAFVQPDRRRPARCAGSAPAQRIDKQIG